MALPVPQNSPRGGNLFETIISALVVLVAIGFMIFFFNRTSTGHLGSYALKVSMGDASGLSAGSEVRLGGVKIGAVTGLALEPVTYRALVDIRIRDDLALPVDSVATATASPMGGMHLALSPGRAKAVLAEGDVIGRPRRAPSRQAQPNS
jgi:phospholipid/cholesterol/gamma-HCH transport system substrate-binding protein